jgi:hypothetical protein
MEALPCAAEASLWMTSSSLNDKPGQRFQEVQSVRNHTNMLSHALCCISFRSAIKAAVLEIACRVSAPGCRWQCLGLCDGCRSGPLSVQKASHTLITSFAREETFVLRRTCFTSSLRCCYQLVRFCFLHHKQGRCLERRQFLLEECKCLAWENTLGPWSFKP